jgi:hypothetical protein
MKSRKNPNVPSAESRGLRFVVGCEGTECFCMHLTRSHMAKYAYPREVHLIRMFSMRSGQQELTEANNVDWRIRPEPSVIPNIRVASILRST